MFYFIPCEVCHNIFALLGNVAQPDFMLPECPNRPTSNPNSPGSIILAPVSLTGNDPPFTFGDSFNYVCEDSVNFILNPANPLTSCLVDGTFTLDGNPPICEQISEYRIFMFSQTNNCFFL